MAVPPRPEARAPRGATCAGPDRPRILGTSPRSAMLLLALLACTEPGPADDSGLPSTDDTGGDGTGAPGGDPDGDPFVDSSIPAGYTPDALARVIFLGDSITDGSGASRGDLAYRELLVANADDTWPDASGLDIESRFGQVEVVDRSRGGATTDSMRYGQLDGVADDLGDTAPGQTAVVVTIAGNDVQGLIYNTDEVDAVIADILDNLEATYDFFEDPVRFPDGVWFYLANVYEPSDGVGQADACFFGLELSEVLTALGQVNDAVRDQAEERGIAWLDMRGHFNGHGYYADDPTNPYYHPDDPTLWFASDCIHPNDRGHHEIRRLFWYALAGETFPGDGPDPF